MSAPLDARPRGRNLRQADGAQAGIKRIPLRMPDGLTGQTCVTPPSTMSRPESDSTTVHSQRSGIPSLVTVFALLILLYLLSFGPVARYYMYRPTPRAIEILYAPLINLADNSRPVRNLLFWYADLWGVK